MPTGQPATLESLEATHANAPNPRAQAVTRGRARALAARMGSDAPAWAAQRPKQAKRNRDAELQRRRQERIEQRERDRKEREALRRAPPAEPPPPPAIAEPLRRWAQSEQGVVTVSHDGAITLTMWTAGGSKLEARFPSTTSALEALVAGAIDWRAAAPKPRSQRPGGVRPLVVEAAP